MDSRFSSADTQALLLGDDDELLRRDSIRTLSWEKAALLLALLPPRSRRSLHGLWVMSGGNRIVHWVPPPLRHIGCMWLEDGYEDLRCGRPPAWTLGRELSLARLYCEEHGRAILARREIVNTRKVRPRDPGVQEIVNSRRVVRIG
jgi:hypothetical protein